MKPDGDTCVVYCAHTGIDYRVDVSKMVQTKLRTGSRRTILREVHEGYGIVWSFDASRRTSRSEHRAVYMQYPDEVSAVLEHRYRCLCAASSAVRVDPSSPKGREVAVQMLSDGALRLIFGLPVDENCTTSDICTSSDDREKGVESHADATSGVHTGSSAAASSGNDSVCSEGAEKRCKPGSHGSDKVDASSSDDGGRTSEIFGLGTHIAVPQNARPSQSLTSSSTSRRGKIRAAARLAARVGPVEPELAECLFERVLQRRWPPAEVARAVRWLRRRGLQCSPSHCRKAALLHASLTVLRVLLTEAHVDIRSLELLAEAPAAGVRGQAAGNSSNGGWVQRCKVAVKVLLARGAFLGGVGARSKLLRRLEEDGDTLLRARALATLCRPLPDVLLRCIGAFADIPPPYAWRDDGWGVQGSPATETGGLHP